MILNLKMDFIFKIGIFALCFHLAVCSVETYTAAYGREDVTIENYASLIQEASKMNADILVLPSPELASYENIHDICSTDKYDEIVNSISLAAKEGKLYVVAHVLEKIRCQKQEEIVRNNFVFDRQGSIVSVYRKPLHSSAKCNITNTDTSVFKTDFGVTFGLLMEEDLVLKNPEHLKGVKNFVLTGKTTTNIPFLSANEFSASWTYARNANLISGKGIFIGRSGLKTASGRIFATQLLKEGGQDQSTINFNGPSKLTSFPGEDLSQYTIKPMDMEASAHGYHTIVCHGTFCCNFHLKTSFLGNPKEVNYGLVAFSGVQHFDQYHSIGVQSCAIVACAGLYKRSCFISTGNATNIVFDELSISGNFMKNSVQFPIVQSTVETTIEANNFYMKEESSDNKKHVIAEFYNAKDLLRFGIFGRDYSKDIQTSFQDQNKTQVFSEASDYISIENVEEFFDYLWIRLRIVIVVVSIYILEMM